jgi:hypothetical protein
VHLGNYVIHPTAISKRSEDEESDEKENDGKKRSGGN